jgi:hypothetical protein
MPEGLGISWGVLGHFLGFAQELLLMSARQAQAFSISK